MQSTLMCRLMILLLVLGGCGKADKNRSQPSPENGENGSGDQGKSGNSPSEETVWYGFASRCLVSAEEVKVPLENGSGHTIKQSTICSPKYSDGSFQDLEKKLNEWKKANCPEAVPVKNGIPGNWGGCVLTPHGSHNVISNSASSVDEKLSDLDYCGGKPGRSYATVKC